MKRIQIAVLTFFLVGISVFAQVQPNKLIVKFKSNSPMAKEWFATSRIGEIVEFRNLLGSHASSAFISQLTLQAMQKRLNEISEARTSLENTSIIDNLSRICVIDFTAPIDIIFAARKISSFADVEYAESMPVHKFSSTPNDPAVALQYHLSLVKSFSAWDSIPAGNLAILAVVDTGVDYTHEDLSANIYSNPGETGLDKNGNDKRTNGIDDDGDGFVDNWHGWDFCGSNGTTPDNDPKPGNIHGTHVAGITGAVANNNKGGSGVAGSQIKILPVKVSGDNPYDNSIAKGYEGIAFAAAMGAAVINCSWGGGSSAASEQEVINAAMKLGALVVCAAGNNYINQDFYPASYDGVISVASTTQSDQKSDFSNFGSKVDVTAPGSSIYSTVPNNKYMYMDGTSMASPVAAGVAALIKMKFPQYTPYQIGEQLKATTDNIDKINPSYVGFIGTGRVNAFKAVTSTDVKSIALKSYTISDANGNGILEPGEQVQLTLVAQNIMSPIVAANGTVTSISSIQPTFINASCNFGAMQTNEEKTGSVKIVFTIPASVPENYPLTLIITFKDSTNNAGRGVISLTLNPTYRTLAANDISVTVNSRGNLAYNDYSFNLQGDGFTFKNSSNLLFEGALMVATSADNISDVARGADGSTQNTSFLTQQNILVSTPGILSNLEASTTYSDKNAANTAGISVRQNCYQFSDSASSGFIIFSYSLKNMSGSDMTSLFAGLYCDWDIGPSGAKNLATFDDDSGFAYCKSTLDATLPWTGMLLLSNQTLNYFAMDNDGATQDNPGVYDGFTASEKWQTLSSGLTRKTSSITDVSTVISAGPIALANNDSTTVSFAFFGGKDLAELKSNAAKARAKSQVMGLWDEGHFTPAQATQLLSVSPNVLSTNDPSIIKIDYDLLSYGYVSIDVTDMMGRIIATILNSNEPQLGGHHQESFNTSGLSSGNYFVRFRNLDKIEVIPFIVTR